MSGNANSGRRPSAPVDVAGLAVLTVPQALRLLRQLGRPMGRKKLGQQIATGRLRAQVDYLRLDNQGRPTYKIERQELDRWLRASLVPLKVTALAS